MILHKRFALSYGLCYSSFNAFFCLLLLFCLVSGLASATGLTLYSYYDDRGQQIVVDSLERIPEKFRAQAKKSFIPSFRSEKPVRNEPPPASPATIEVVDMLPETVSSGVVELAVIEPPPEEERLDPAFATATLLLDYMDRIVNRNELLYGLSFKFTIRHPAVHHQHLSNLIELRNIRDPHSIEFEEPNNWAVEAADVVERLRAIQYTVSSWLETGSGELLSTLPTMIEASRRHVRHIRGILEALQAAAEAKIAARKQK